MSNILPPAGPSATHTTPTPEQAQRWLDSVAFAADLWIPPSGDPDLDKAMAAVLPDLAAVHKRLRAIDYQADNSGLTDDLAAERDALLGARDDLLRQAGEAAEAGWSPESRRAAETDRAERLARQRGDAEAARRAHEELQWKYSNNCITEALRVLASEAGRRGLVGVTAAIDDDGAADTDELLRGDAAPPDLLAIGHLVVDEVNGGEDRRAVSMASRFAAMCGLTVSALRPSAQRLYNLVRAAVVASKGAPLSDAQAIVVHLRWLEQPGDSAPLAAEPAEVKPAEATDARDEDTVDPHHEDDAEADGKDFFAGIRLPTLGAEFVDYIRSQSFRELPTDAMYISAALSLVNVTIGQTRRTEDGKRANGQYLSTAGTGVGKQAPQSAVSRTAAAADLAPRLMSGDFTSASGLFRRLQGSPTTLWMNDESGYMLRAAMDPRSDSVTASKISALLEMFSHDEREWTPKSYAKNEDTITLKWPVLSVLLSCTPETLWTSSVTREQVANGFLGRLLHFPGPDTIEGCPARRVVQAPPPARIVEVIKSFARVGVKEAMEIDAGGAVVSYSPDAIGLLDRFRSTCDERLLSGGPLGVIWARAPEKVSQTILPLLFMRDPSALVAQADDVDLAIRIVEAGTWSLVRAAGRDLLITGAAGEQLQRSILRPIRAAGAKGVARSALLRLTGLLARQLDEGLQTLLAARRIRVEEVTVRRANGSAGTAHRFYLRTRGNS